MLVLHDPDTLLHETIELLCAKVRPAHESSIRVLMIMKDAQAADHEVRTLESPVDEKLDRLKELILKTHTHDYIEHLEVVHDEWVSADLVGADDSILPECFFFTTAAKGIPKRPKDIYARAGYYAFDMSVGIMNKTFQAIMASASLAMEAADIVKEDKDKGASVMALTRPPGHHCDGHRAGGYCYVNNASVAVSSWREKYPDAKIGIIDVDFHHGNGTQDVFYEDPNVFYTSIHGEDEFPYYTGSANEKGEGDAYGTTLNLPLATGSSFQEYCQKLETALESLDAFKIEFLIVSLGLDTFHLDPLGNFQIQSEDYAIMGKTIRQRLARRPAVILLEGGYVAEHIGTNVVSFLKGWEEAIDW